jgi:hypothetical protein
MKRSLATVVILLAIFISGCNTSPQQGPPGPQGAQGRSGDRDHRDDQGQSGQRDQRGSGAPCPAGQHSYTDPASREVRCVRD